MRTVQLNDHRITVDISVQPITSDFVSEDFILEKNDSEKNEIRLLIEFSHLDRHLKISREENLLAQHETIRALLRSMAHEVKNPLGGIRGAAQLLERELENPELAEYSSS